MIYNTRHNTIQLIEYTCYLILISIAIYKLSKYAFIYSFIILIIKYSGMVMKI